MTKVLNKVVAEELEVMAITPEQDAFRQMVYEEHLGNRVIIINDEINEFTFERVTMQIQKFNREDKHKTPSERKPIVLHIGSVGGNITDGLHLIDVIKNSKTPVYGVAYKAYSMAAFIYVACHKRYAFENSSVLFHDGSTVTYGTTLKAKDHMNYVDNLWERLESIVIEKTGITKELYEQHRKDEWYIFANLAKELGVVDFVIGEDVEMDEIIL